MPESAARSAARSRAEAIKISRTLDYLILFTAFFVILGGYHIHYMLTGGDWDFWTDWKDRRLWVTVAPIVSITFPAAVQACLWYRYRLPFGAVVCVLGLLLGEWINRYMNFWGWTYFPVNFCFPSNLMPGAIVLDVILMLSNSMTLTAVVGGMAWGVIFYPSNWPIIAPLHIPVEYNGMMFTLADLQGYHYIRTGTPEYIRMVEKGTLRTFGKDTTPVSAFFSAFVCILIYFWWHFFGRWFSSPDFVASEALSVSTQYAAVQSQARQEEIIKASSYYPTLVITPKPIDAIKLGTAAQAPSDRPFFYYDVSGDFCNGKECLVNSELKLEFGINKLSETAVKAIGNKLKNLEYIDFSIIADGFKLSPVKGNVWRKTLWLSETGDPSKPTYIEFTYISINSGNDNTGFSVYVDYQGIPVYHFWIPVSVVNKPPLMKKKEQEHLSSIDLDITDILEQAKKSTPSDMRISLYDEDPQILLSVHLLKNGKYLDDNDYRPIKGITVGKFQQAVGTAIKRIETIAKDPIWEDWNLNSNRDKFIPELKEVARVGWALRLSLYATKNDAFKELIDTIEQLDVDSRITVNTNTLGFPWDILYTKDPDKELEPWNFWGIRYRIECFRSNIRSESHTPKNTSSAKADGSKLTCIIDSSLDEITSHAIELKKKLSSPVIPEFINQCGLCDERKKAIKYGTDHCIYIFCHGLRAEPLETDEALALEKGSVRDCTFYPWDLHDSGTYGANPLVIINACGAAAMCAFSLTSFSEQFKLKNAQGIVGPVFAVPVASATLMGEALLIGYLVDKNKIGDVLAAIRRQWIAVGNPIPLFYQLQCSMEARSR